jgi:hypothetical protein
MGILAWIGLIAFIAYVAKSGYDVATGGGSANWIDLDDDDDVSSWDDDWLDDDIITSPVYSFMACNIWHDPFEDNFSWSSDDDFDWGSDDD